MRIDSQKRKFQAGLVETPNLSRCCCLLLARQDDQDEGMAFSGKELPDGASAGRMLFRLCALCTQLPLGKAQKEADQLAEAYFSIFSQSMGPGFHFLTTPDLNPGGSLWTSREPLGFKSIVVVKKWSPEWGMSPPVILCLGSSLELGHQAIANDYVPKADPRSRHLRSMRARAACQVPDVDKPFVGAMPVLLKKPRIYNDDEACHSCILVDSVIQSYTYDSSLELRKHAATLEWHLKRSQKQSRKQMESCWSLPRHAGHSESWALCTVGCFLATT